MRSKRFTAAALCLVAALTLVNRASAQAQTERERAQELWEEAVRAKGGRERLRSVKSLLITSTVYARAQRGSNTKDAVRLYAMPGRAWVYTYTEAFDVKVDATVLNKERGLCLLTLAPAHGVNGLSPCLAETWVQYLIQDPFIYLLETEWIRPAPLRARTEGRLDVVETEVGSLRADFYLNRKTRLPVRVVTEWMGGVGRATGSLGKMEVLLEDYAEVEGVWMPRRVTRRLLDAKRESVGDPLSGDEERSRYRFNVEFDPAVFDHPIPKDVKADDWKAR